MFLNQHSFFLSIFLFVAIQLLCEAPLLEQFRQTGYVEILNKEHTSSSFDALYAYFDEFIEFFQANPRWREKLYCAKERFIRSKDQKYYSTGFFGFYDESKKEERGQISFYYSPHFHEFICSRYPEFNQIPKIVCFLNACFEIQKPYRSIFSKAAAQLGLEEILSSKEDDPFVLFKVVKYFPSYVPTRPHYDGTAFSLFLDSTDNQALLLSPYKASFSIDDFSSPFREFSRWHSPNSILLIPGALLTEFSIYPTPHIVLQSGSIRYAAIAFAMISNYTDKKIELSSLPNFKR